MKKEKQSIKLRGRKDKKEPNRNLYNITPKNER